MIGLRRIKELMYNAIREERPDEDWTVDYKALKVMQDFADKLAIAICEYIRDELGGVFTNANIDIAINRILPTFYSDYEYEM